ncbi:hypothetical protein C5O00_02680 [Pukyongia salina]|uniref:Uncharacterized protein n=1 Tax=Pukyongia salina TaxID=2094025 RepID=A0A2S0HTZ8_9FLAO|nr:hypothetical protein [Pukyongia salina]AVI50132.1 hypothetical protein C5O00_02680 [Pukyongia salina]
MYEKVMHIIFLLCVSCSSDDEPCNCHRVVEIYEDFELIETVEYEPGTCDQEQWAIYNAINMNDQSPNFGDGNISYFKCDDGTEIRD